MPATFARAYHTLLEGIHHSPGWCESRWEECLRGGPGAEKGGRWIACHVSRVKCTSSTSMPASWTSRKCTRSSAWSLRSSCPFQAESESSCQVGPFCGPRSGPAMLAQTHRDPRTRLQKGRAVAESASVSTAAEDDVASTAAGEEFDRAVESAPETNGGKFEDKVEMGVSEEMVNGNGSVALLMEEDRKDGEGSAEGPLVGDSEAVPAKKESGDGRLVSVEELRREVARRRNFAIISHPDAGKTTLTEKLLLYGGAIHEAGAVKARRAARHATSDWMELERQRGISITSTALVFETKGYQVTLLDTPGHQDFGEDTYRTLAAADNAVMLVDAGKGLEPQTRKLFEVCRMRKLPIFTFINKLDRPSLDPLELIDEIEKEFQLTTYPVNWPIGSGDRFMGVYDRLSGKVHLFERDRKHGSKEATVKIMSLQDPSLPNLMDKDLYTRLQDDIELLEELAPPLSLDDVRSGNLSLVFFGSAMNNFGVELFLDAFLRHALPPGSHDSDSGKVAPDYPHFTGFVFKLQANMDPKHRDKVAFLRVCSGQFAKGMKVQISRTNRTIALTRPQKLFAQDRTTVETGFAGDVIGLNNPNAFCIGDTVYVGPKRSFPHIPSFSPELFCYVRNSNPSKYKQFQKGLSELLGEGAVQILYSVEGGRQDPMLAAVGQLQFEVVKFRLQNEYGVDVTLEPIGYTVARWPLGEWEALERVGRLFNCVTVKDMWGRPVLLFRNAWNVNQLLGDKPEIGELAPYCLPPAETKK